MSQMIEVSEETAALLKRQAEARGIPVEVWVEALAKGKGQPSGAQGNRRGKPETSHWITGEYVPRTVLRRSPSFRLVIPL